jgi:hypothetical protein
MALLGFSAIQKRNWTSKTLMYLATLTLEEMVSSGKMK